MGFTPSEVEEMSLWQFDVAFDGWCKSKGVDQKEDILTDDNIDLLDSIIAGNA